MCPFQIDGQIAISLASGRSPHPPGNEPRHSILHYPREGKCSRLKAVPSLRDRRFTCQSAEQISPRKQHKTKNSTPEIEVMNPHSA